MLLNNENKNLCGYRLVKIKNYVVETKKNIILKLRKYERL